MENLLVKGNQKFMGINIPVIEGGFGDNCRVVSGKVISDIHNIRLSDINASINRLINKNRIKEGIDYINILSETVSLRDFAKELGMLSSNRTKDAFILSERGYAKLVKAMDDDKSWDIMDKFIDEYFVMRKVINSDEQLKAKLLLSIYNGGQEGVLASKELTEIEIKEATKPLLKTIDTQNQTIDKQEKKLEIQRPFVEMAIKLIKSKNAISFGEASKSLTGDGINIGRNELMELLREKKVLGDGNGSLKKNEPYAKYAKEPSRCFVYSVTTKTDRYGREHIVPVTMVTGKGLIFLNKKLREWMGLEQVDTDAELTEAVNQK